MTPRTLELLELVDELQGTGRIGKAKSLARIAQLLRAMSGSERRALAIEVAREVAPDLLPEIEEATDLSYDDISGLVGRVRRLDGDQLRTVAEALRDLEISPEPAPAHDQDETRGIPTTSDTTEPDPETEWVEEPEPEIRSEPAPARDHDETRGITTTSHDLGELGRSAEAEPDWVGQPPLDTEIRSEPADARDHNETRGIPATSRLAEVPDGWRRRRLALDLIAATEVDGAEARAVIGLFARSTDRSWVAGAMVDRGLVTVDDLTELLAPSVRTRLARRQAA